jgi:hypothetical protein
MKLMGCFSSRGAIGAVFLLCALPVAPLCAVAAPTGLNMDMDAVLEVLPHALEALAISERAALRETRHKAELAKKGMAEEPPDAKARYSIDAGAAGRFVFDNFGEFYIDRRFVTDKEMETVRKIEAWFRKHFPVRRKDGKRAVIPSRKPAKTKIPVFRGFEHPRYQKHDDLIVSTVAEFNSAKAKWCGGSATQAARIPDITPALVKSHMIEESGGNGLRSREAWEVDPLQVNVPGDWGAEKELVGLHRPQRRNEGTLAGNVRAAIMYLARKGFSAAARPAAERPKGYFDGWKQALRRYNGRRDRTDTDRCYSEEYADKILRRAADPDRFVPVEIKLAAKRSPVGEKTTDDDSDQWWMLW